MLKMTLGLVNDDDSIVSSKFLFLFITVINE